MLEKHALCNSITDLLNFLKAIKKEEHETRSTNVKTITTYFKDSFRNALFGTGSNYKNKFSLKPLGKNLREQVAWTILAEIVIARSQESGEDLFSSFVILIMFHLL